MICPPGHQAPATESQEKGALSRLPHAAPWSTSPALQPCGRLRLAGTAALTPAEWLHLLAGSKRSVGITGMESGAVSRESLLCLLCLFPEPQFAHQQNEYKHEYVLDHLITWGGGTIIIPSV